MATVDFKALKARISISEILEHYGLRDLMAETETGFKGPCPFDESHGNALKVAVEKNAFYWGPVEEPPNLTSQGNLLSF